MTRRRWTETKRGFHRVTRSRSRQRKSKQRRRQRHKRRGGYHDKWKHFWGGRWTFEEKTEENIRKRTKELQDQHAEMCTQYRRDLRRLQALRRETEVLEKKWRDSMSSPSYSTSPNWTRRSAEMASLRQRKEEDASWSGRSPETGYYIAREDQNSNYPKEKYMRPEKYYSGRSARRRQRKEKKRLQEQPYGGMYFSDPESSADQEAMTGSESEQR